VNLTDIFDSTSCSVKLSARSKDGAIRALAALAAHNEEVGAAREEIVARALSEREAQGSTGFGNEIAIPHARIENLDRFVVFIAHAPKGVEFDSLDRKRVRLFFVILGPENRPSEHVQILAAISRSLSNTSLKKELLAALTVEAMQESFLRHAGEKQETPTKKQKMKLLILILYMDELIYHILEYFLETGIEGATILESSGMGQYVSSIPLFATFIGFMNKQKNHSNTLLATIPANRENEIVRGIEAITGNLDKKQGAMLMTFDIDRYKGTMKVI